MHFSFPWMRYHNGTTLRRSQTQSSDQSLKRPTMTTVFDNSPNARSTTMKTVEGPHTYGVSIVLSCDHSPLTDPGHLSASVLMRSLLNQEPTRWELLRTSERVEPWKTRIPSSSTSPASKDKVSSLYSTVMQANTPQNGVDSISMRFVCSEAETQ